MVTQIALDLMDFYLKELEHLAVSLPRGLLIKATKPLLNQIDIEHAVKTVRHI